MRIRILMTLVSFGIILGSARWVYSAVPHLSAQSTASLAGRLVGAWHLVSVETIRPNGEVIYPFYGKHPEGLLVYDPSGWMSVQIVSDPKPSVPTTDSRADFLAAPASEKALAADGYYAYFGTWSLDGTGTTVIHHVQQSLLPGERGENSPRHLHLDGNRLTLYATVHEMGEERARKLVWERAVSNGH